MKKTFLRRFVSTIVALSMVAVPMPTGTFAVETSPDTAEMSVTNNDMESDFESGG